MSAEESSHCQDIAAAKSEDFMCQWKQIDLHVSIEAN